MDTCTRPLPGGSMPSIARMRAGLFRRFMKARGHRGFTLPALWRLVVALVALLLLALPPLARSQGSLEEMAGIVAEASARAAPWQGPVDGPAGVTGRTVALVTEDLRNGGVLGVARAVEEAARELRWQLRLFDAGGTQEGRRKALADAHGGKPDGVILIGSDAEALRLALEAFARRGTPIVGWHVASQAGVMPGPVRMNVSTDPVDVATVAALAAIVGGRGEAGVVIFTDSRFKIALAKSDAMLKLFSGCGGCVVLDVHDLPISRAAERVPAVVREMLARHGERLTHMLAINDIYFDYAVPEMIRAGVASDRIALLSAGDGSAAAFLRIKAGAYQTATVAEPLSLHGWQLVDELNRLFAGRPVSGFIAPAHLVTRDNIAYDGGQRFVYDPDNGYRDIYRRIWKTD